MPIYTGATANENSTHIGYLLQHPESESPGTPVARYPDSLYQAKRWDRPRWVVAKVEWHRGELFARVGFIVTDLAYPPKGVTRFFNGRSQRRAKKSPIRRKYPVWVAGPTATQASSALRSSPDFHGRWRSPVMKSTDRIVDQQQANF